MHGGRRRGTITLRGGPTSPLRQPMGRPTFGRVFGLRPVQAGPTTSTNPLGNIAIFSITCGKPSSVMRLIFVGMARITIEILWRCLKTLM